MASSPKRNSHQNDNVGAVLSSGGALQIIAPSPQSSRDEELRDEGLAYDKMLANAEASGAGAANKDNPLDRGDDSVVPQVKPEEYAYDVECCGALDDAGDKKANARNRPPRTQESLDEKYQTSYALARNHRIIKEEAKEQSLKSESTLRGAQSRCSRSIADLDVVIGKADTTSALTEDIAYDVEEALGLNDGPGVSDCVDDEDESDVFGFADDAFGDDAFGEKESAYENNARALDFLRESVRERSSRTSFDDVLKSDSFASHEILKNINEAAERKRSTESSRCSGSVERVIEFAPPPNDAWNDSNAFPRERNHVDLLEKRAPAIPKDPEENRSPHGILDVISEAARSTPTRALKEDSYVAMEENTERSNAASPTSSTACDDGSLRSSPVDPPGDVSLTSNGNVADVLADLRTVRRDALAALQSAAEDDGLSGYAADRAGCKNTFVEQTRETFPCKQGRNDDDLAGVQVSFFDSPKNEWNQSFSNVPPQRLRDPESNVVSDDDDEEGNISRPWKAKWDDDPFAKHFENASDGARMVSRASPTAFDTPDGSNYDPDSDWDVDDTEVEFGAMEESFVASPAGKGDGPQQVW